MDSASLVNASLGDLLSRRSLQEIEDLLDIVDNHTKDTLHVPYIGTNKNLQITNLHDVTISVANIL